MKHTEKKEDGREWVWCSDCRSKEDEKHLCKDCYLKCPITDEYRVLREKK